MVRRKRKVGNLMPERQLAMAMKMDECEQFAY